MGSDGTLERTFTVAAWLREDTVAELFVDASPWGLGAALRLDGTWTAWLSDASTEEDKTVLEVEIGSSKVQQLAECLCALVAFRAWLPRLQGRVFLKVRGDSVAMLTLILKRKARANAKGIGTVARELALDVASRVYEPRVAKHTPGVAHKLEDSFS